MTNEEALELLKDTNLILRCSFTGDIRIVEAIDMAIKALGKDTNVPGKEIICCKDCKFANMTVDGECKYCDIWFPDEKIYLDGDYYCGSAERRGDAE